MKTPHKYTITIDDNVGAGAYVYEYSLDGDEVSIYDIAEKIAAGFNVPTPEGEYKILREYNTVESSSTVL